LFAHVALSISSFDVKVSRVAIASVVSFDGEERRSPINYVFIIMMNPSESDFTNDEPLAAMDSGGIQDTDGGTPRWRGSAERAAGTAGDAWQQTKQKASLARERTEYFLRENPVPTIIGALAVGVAIGWALRHSIGDDEDEIEVNSPVGNVNWSFLSLPFLWPFFKSVKEKYEDSAETVKEGVDRLRDIDVKRYTKPMRRYTKPIRKRWKAWTD
jgi:hypothetical protein